MTHPVVDVGIPTRRRPELLVQAIESVVAQTFDFWRLDISESDVGGGEVGAVVSPYLADPRINYSAVGREIDGAENWTRLIRAGAAPYVALLHDDDLWDRSFLERRVDFLERHPECGFVFSANREIDAAGRTVREVPFALPEGVHQPREFAPVLFAHNPIGSPSIVVRRSAYEAVGPYFDARHSPFWDYEMWLRLAVRYPVGYLAVRDCAYRMHDARMTFEVRRFGRAYRRIVERADELIRRELPEARLPPRLRRRRFSQAYLISALDAVEDSQARQALTFLGRAARAHPGAIVDPRFGLALASLGLGARGRRALGRARLFVHRRGIRPHLFG